ncbi:MAG TPA: sigma-54-dependent Fis family transcriptional regulator [Clostridiales bacterium]|jgi:PAS domain S-box-containing protein|nr:sigma-54-dependent Fis family transcriptional regulator [Clostridiales bacterium]
MKKELETFLASTQDGVISIDKNCKINLINKKAAELIGVKREEAINKDINKVVKDTRLPHVLKTGKHELDWQQKLGKYQIITSRIPLKDNNGKIIGAIAVFRNITDVVNLDKQLNNLNEYKSLLQAVFSAVQDAISVVDTKGYHIMVNPAYTKVTGISAEEIMGKYANYDLKEGDSLHIKVLKTKKPVKNTKIVTKPSGKVVIAQAAPILVDNKLKGSVAVLHDITEIRNLTKELSEAQKRIRELSAKYSFDDIVGKCKNIIEAKEQLIKAANVPATVLLKGESGTGKELFAHAIHNEGTRKENQFVRVNCAALSETLLESELFGYEEGAFTGAKKGGKKGLFEEANNGTIFLDEISEISSNTQVKLLRVLQEKEITRVGGVKPIHVNVRVVAATNEDLYKLVKEGNFREDLYYRLNVFPIQIPPLRERKKDIDFLVKKFINKYNIEYGRNVNRIDIRALNILKQYDWPGNVRELENVIGRAMINMSFNEVEINDSHIPILFSELNNTNNEIIDKKSEYKSLSQALENYEKKYIEKIYYQEDKNKTKTAEKLNISIRSLYYKFSRYGIE